MAEMQDRYIVVMGDLVESENAPSQNALHQYFNAAVDEANVEFAQDLSSPLTITLGDEFQGLCGRLSVGIAVMRGIRSRLLAQQIECRFVVGSVSLETPLNAVRAWNMMGPGLATAREKLERKRETNIYRFSLNDDPVAQTLMEGVGMALTNIEASWTSRQQEVVLASMDSERHSTALARQFGIEPSVFYKIRRAAKFDLYRQLWSALDAAAEMIDTQRGRQ